MTRVYKSICMEIDDLTIKIMNLSEELISYKMEVEFQSNSGFYNIAKARYIMGTKCVSTLQLPTIHSNPIQPLFKVCRKMDNGHVIFKPIKKEPGPLSSDEKLLKKNIEVDTTRADVIEDLFSNDIQTLRKRKEFYLVDDNNYTELNEELQAEVASETSNSSDSLISFADPIRLFGVLVPYTLRLAQKDFQEALDVIVKCASTQLEMTAILERYSHLKHVKIMMERAAKERHIDLHEPEIYWTPSEHTTENSSAGLSYSAVSAVSSKESELLTVEELETEADKDSEEIEVQGEQDFESFSAIEGEAEFIEIASFFKGSSESEDNIKADENATAGP